MKKKWMAVIGGVVIAVIVLVPSQIETELVTGFYRSHPWVSGLLIVTLFALVGRWLRNQSEWKLKKPS